MSVSENESVKVTVRWRPVKPNDLFFQQIKGVVGDAGAEDRVGWEVASRESSVQKTINDGNGSAAGRPVLLERFFSGKVPDVQFDKDHPETGPGGSTKFGVRKKSQSKNSFGGMIGLVLHFFKAGSRK